VCTAAWKALASFARPEDLPLLRKLAKDQYWRVGTAAVEALASLSRPEDLPLLRERALTPDDEVALEAIRALGSRCSREELEVFLNRHDHELSAVALAVLDELLYMPGVAEAEREYSVNGILSVSCTDPNNYPSERFKTFSRKSRNSEHAMSLYGG
jgi:HEAT repeat protein